MTDRAIPFRIHSGSRVSSAARRPGPASAAGFSLVEVSLILMVAVILTGMMVPAVSSTLADAKLTAAKAMLHQISGALSRFLEDVGCKAVPQSGQDGGPRHRAPSSFGPSGPPPPELPPAGSASDPGHMAAAFADGSAGPAARGGRGNGFGPGGTPCAKGKMCGGPIVELLVSTGDVPGLGPEGSSRWVQQVDFRDVDFMEYYLVSNTPGNDPGRAFPTPDDCPGRGLGRFQRPNWRGAYLGAPVGPDPWGNRFMVNVEHLEPGNTEDIVILSAGPDEEVDSAYSRDGFVPGDDDLIVLFSPGTGKGHGDGGSDGSSDGSSDGGSDDRSDDGSGHGRF